jgi:hypothetical protein
MRGGAPFQLHPAVPHAPPQQHDPAGSPYAHSTAVPYAPAYGTIPAMPAQPLLYAVPAPPLSGGPDSANSYGHAAALQPGSPFIGATVVPLHVVHLAVPGHVETITTPSAATPPLSRASYPGMPGREVPPERMRAGGYAATKAAAQVLPRAASHHELASVTRPPG